MRSKLEAGYDRLAGWYVWLERLRYGGRLERARVSLVPELAAYRQVLFLGDGDGRLLAAFQQAHPTAQITSVDVSREMLRRQQQRTTVAGDGRTIQWLHADLTTLAMEADTFDLVVTAFFLDCFDGPQLDLLLPRVAVWLRRDAGWYVVDFHVPPRGLRKHWAEGWLWGMHAFFRWQTGLTSRQLVDFGGKLKALGFSVERQQQFAGDTLRATLYRRVSAGTRAVADFR